MTNRLSLARQTLDMTTTAAPVNEARITTPRSSTTPRTTTTTPQTTTTTMSTTTISLVPYSYDEVSLQPPTAAEAAIIKVLEEAVKIEHQRRERERIATRRELEQQRSRRHAWDSASFLDTRLPYHPPRCTCGLPLHKAGRSRFSGLQNWSGPSECFQTPIATVGPDIDIANAKKSS